jgi:hypothetical protein
LKLEAASVEPDISRCFINFLLQFVKKIWTRAFSLDKIKKYFIPAFFIQAFFALRALIDSFKPAFFFDFSRLKYRNLFAR